MNNSCPTCGFCDAEMKLAEAAYCAVCETPHHQECFMQKGCTAYGCGKTVYFVGDERESIYNAKGKITALALREENLPVGGDSLDSFFEERKKVAQEYPTVENKKALEEIIFGRIGVQHAAERTYLQQASEGYTKIEKKYADEIEKLIPEWYSDIPGYGIIGGLMSICAGVGLMYNHLENIPLGISLIFGLLPIELSFWLESHLTKRIKKQPHYLQQLKRIEEDKTAALDMLKADYRKKLEDLARIEGEG